MNYRHNDQNKETRSCFVCKKAGHLKKDCRVWKARMEQENNKQPKSKHKAKNAIATELHGSDSETDDTNHGCFTIGIGQMTSDWFIDSGATTHMTNNLSFFKVLDQTKTDQIYIANGTSINADGIGHGYLDCMLDDGTVHRIEVKDVLYAPTLTGSLLSVKKLTSKGKKVEFTDKHCFIRDNQKLLAVGKLESNLYKLSCKHKSELANMAKSEVKHQDCIHSWHRRLGHRDPNAIKCIINEGLATGIHINDCNVMMKCEHCIKGKFTQKPYPEISAHRTREPLDLIHSDVCGPMKTQTPGKNKYIVTFIDDYSRYTMCYLIQNKDEVADKYREFFAEVSNKFQRKPKILRSDNGGEYTGNKLVSFLKQEGIRLQTSVPYSPSQNGVAERKNRSIIEMAKCMLLDAGLSLQYWGEAVMTAVYLQNRLPTKATDKTPFELWNGEKPDLSHIRIFGCKAFAYIPKEKRTKFDDRATEAVLVGYSERSKGYRLLQTDTNRIIISRSVTFVERELNDEMKTVQQMMNHNVTGEKPNVTGEKPQPATNEMIEVEIQMPADNIDDEVEDNNNAEADIDQLRRSTIGAK